MPAALPIAVGVAGVAGSVISAKSNSKAINTSTDASLQANREAIAAQERAFNQGLQFQQNALDQSLGFQRDAYNSTGGLQTQIYNQNVARLNPYTQTGYSAMNSINALLGLPEQQAYQSQPVQFTPIQAQQPQNPAPNPTTPNVAPGTYAPPIANMPQNALLNANAGTGAYPTPDQYTSAYAARLMGVQ